MILDNAGAYYFINGFESILKHILDVYFNFTVVFTIISTCLEEHLASFAGAFIPTNTSGESRTRRELCYLQHTWNQMS